jgi:hypothetical protein
MSATKDIVNHEAHLRLLVEQGDRSFKNLKALVDYLTNQRDSQYTL